MTEEVHTPKRLAKVFESIARISLITLAGLLPIMFLPWTVEPLEVNKQTLLLFLAAISVMAWLGNMVVEKKVYVKKTYIFLIVAILLIVIAVSSASSLAPFYSWVGQAKQEYTSFLSFLGFGLVFVTGSHFLSKTKTQRHLWSVSLMASGLIGLLAVLTQVGARIFSTNFIGSSTGLGVYLAVMAVLGCGLWLVASPEMQKKVLPEGLFGAVVRGSIFVTILSALSVTAALDFWGIWVAMLLGLSIIFTFAIFRAEEFPHTARFVWPMLLFVCAILFLFIPSVALNRYPAEVAPSSKASFTIAKQTLQETSWLVGSGPGTYVMDYTKHHPVEVNNSMLWDQRFDRAGSYFMTLLPTVGLLGVALLLVFIVWIFYLAASLLLTEKAHDEWKMTFVSFAAWSVVVFAMFVYSSNMTLSFLFWMLSAVIVSQAGPTIRRVTFSQSPRYALLTTFLFVVVSVGLLTSMFVSASRYSAEIAFARAVSADRAGESVDTVIEHLDSAARMNKLSDLYYRNLGNALLAKTAQIIQEPDVTATDVQMYIQASITSAERATVISPSYVVNWALLGDVYREVSPLVQGANELAIQAYEKSIELSPNNPKYRVMTARSYLLFADQMNEYLASDDEEFVDEATTALEDALANAESRLQEAIELKPDYASAHYYLAVTYERQGNLTDAVGRMEAIRNTYPSDIGVSFQLGLLYLRQGKSDLAKAEFERSLEIAPNYSNALWYLAAIYEEDGDTDEALELLDKVKELNPDNPMVDQRIERLRQGQEVEEIPEPIVADDGSLTDVDEIEE